MPATLHLLTGPTAVGKTELALRWAERHGAEILSCDSLLFYRGLDIGTAKPTREEQARVRHHLIDICEPGEPMDVVRYTQLAREVALDARERGVPLLVTGGSGFYLAAFFGPVTDGIQVSDTIRASVASLFATEGLPGLLREVRARNPAGLGSLDAANPRRVQRALERCLASGRTLLELQEAFARLPGPFSDFAVKLAVLDRPPLELQERVAARVRAMLAAGLVEEVRRLRPTGLESNPSAAGAIGYRETLACLDGRLPAGELEGTIIANTRALVKKQRTWFRTQLPSHAPLTPEAFATQEVWVTVPALTRG